MQRPRFRVVRRAGDPIRGWVLAALIAAPALGFPADDYAEAFEACRAQTPTEREACCKKTASDCAAQCERDTESQRGSSSMTAEALTEYLLACQGDCATSESDCTTLPGAE